MKVDERGAAFWGRRGAAFNLPRLLSPCTAKFSFWRKSSYRGTPGGNVQGGRWFCERVGGVPNLPRLMFPHADEILKISDCCCPLLTVAAWCCLLSLYCGSIVFRCLPLPIGVSKGMEIEIVIPVSTEPQPTELISIRFYFRNYSRQICRQARQRPVTLQESRQPFVATKVQLAKKKILLKKCPSLAVNRNFIFSKFLPRVKK